MKRLNVSVIGATGYTGEELVRILVRHPRVKVAYVSGKEEREANLQTIFPSLEGKLDLPCKPLDVQEACRKSDLVFLSLPHTVSMRFAPLFLKAGKKVVDISADYRLKDEKTYEAFYKVPHEDKKHLAGAIYGLPELYREKIRTASLVANPGCYPTGAILGLLPGLEGRGLFHPDSLVIDAKSGVTGAGRKAEKSLNFSEVNENFKAYKLFEHQHVPEIDQELTRAAKKKIQVVFVPHLLPLNRGILSTIYVRLKKKMSTAALIAHYQKRYAKEPFVNVYAGGALPELKHVAYSNFCGIGIRVEESKGIAVIVTAIDNLVKGAAGQAVQNMNLMAGFRETDGF